MKTEGGLSIVKTKGGFWKMFWERASEPDPAVAAELFAGGEVRSFWTPEKNWGAGPWGRALQVASESR